MDKNDNLISLDGGGKPNVTADTVREAKASQGPLLELLLLVAEQKWFYFKELKGRGFTTKEALEIVKEPLV